MSGRRSRFIQTLDLSALGAALTSFLALAISGEVMPPVTFAVVMLMALSAVRDRLPWRPSDRFWAWSTAFMLGFSLAMWWFFVGDPLVPIILFTAYLQVMRLHTARSSRHALQIFVIAFGMIVLASALTTSILFLPLSLLFVFCSLHGIVLLTMRREAERTGAWTDLPVRTAPTTPAVAALERLIRGPYTRWVASVSGALLLLASGFFFLLPRYEGRDWFSRLRPPPTDASGMPVASGGGEDSVALGQISQIRLDHTIVMRVSLPEVDTSAGPPLGSLRLRGQSLTTFDGQRWQSEGHSYFDIYHPEQPIRLADAGSENLVQEIAQDRGASSLLYAAPTAIEYIQRGQRAVRVTINVQEDWARVGEASRLAEPFTYRAHTQITGPGPHANSANSRRPRFPAPQGEGELFDQIALHYEGLRSYPRLNPFVEVDAPPQDAAAIRNLAVSWALEAGLNDPISIADEFSRRLRTEYQYTLQPQVTTPDFPIRGFLEDTRAGHCEYFATSLVILLRSLGIPARLATGYLCPEWNASGQFFVVRESHAHAWVEMYAIHRDWAQWLTYDPTPEGGLPQVGQITTLAQLSHWLDAHRFTWYKWVIDLDEVTQRRLYRRLGMDTWRRSIYTGIDRMMDGVDLRRPLASDPMWMAVVTVPLGIALFAAVMWLARRRVRGDAPRVNRQATPYYRQLLRWLSRQGHRRRPSQAPGEFASAVIAVHPEWESIREITAIHCRDRFGRGPLPAEDRQRVEGLVSALVRDA